MLIKKIPQYHSLIIYIFHVFYENHVMIIIKNSYSDFRKYKDYGAQFLPVKGLKYRKSNAFLQIILTQGSLFW